MEVWVVVADDDLRSLLITIGDEAGIKLTEVEPARAGVRLAAGEVPEAVLVEHGALGGALPESLATVPKVAIAAAFPPVDIDSTGPVLVLPLPASLSEVERVLHWLAWDGPQVERSSSMDASSSRPLSI